MPHPDPYSDSPRTPDQNRRIHAILGDYARESGLSATDAKELVLRPLVLALTGQASSKELTVGAADQAIAQLEQRLADLRAQKAARPDAPADPRDVATITPQQQKSILECFALLDMGTNEQQRGFCVRQCGLPMAQTQTHADQIFQALKAMAQRRYPADDLARRVRAARLDEAQLDTWKRTFLADLDRRFVAAGSRPSKVWSPGRVVKVLEIEAALGRTARVAA